MSYNKPVFLANSKKELSQGRTSEKSPASQNSRSPGPVPQPMP